MVTKFSIDELNKSSVVSSSSGVHNVLFWVLICVIHAVLYSSGNTRCARYKVCTVQGVHTSFGWFDCTEPSPHMPQFMVPISKSRSGARGLEHARSAGNLVPSNKHKEREDTG